MTKIQIGRSQYLLPGASINQVSIFLIELMTHRVCSPSPYARKNLADFRLTFEISEMT